MTKPGPRAARPLADILGKTFNDVFARQGFASRELVTRWSEIAGAEIAAHSQPLRIKWPRPIEGTPPEPATLVLRVEGPMALDIQHAADVIVERVNRFFGWPAIGRLAFRQAPLSVPEVVQAPAPPDPRMVEALARDIPVEDAELREALARLGASLKGK